jgi:hypothetical protein
MRVTIVHIFQIWIRKTLTKMVLVMPVILIKTMMESLMKKITVLLHQILIRRILMVMG